MLTFGRDYFPTRDPSYASQQFDTHSDAAGIQYHAATQGLMPGLSSDDLLRVVNVNGDTRRYVATQLVPSSLVVQPAIGADAVLLSVRPSSAREWAFNGDVRIENGTRVRITDGPQTDEDGYEMVRVQFTAGGYILGTCPCCGESPPIPPTCTSHGLGHTGAGPLHPTIS